MKYWVILPGTPPFWIETDRVDQILPKVRRLLGHFGRNQDYIGKIRVYNFDSLSRVDLPSEHLTVGQLRALLANLPDHLPVCFFDGEKDIMVKAEVLKQ